MNRILFEASELLPDSKVKIGDHRARHMREVLKVKAGDIIRVGQIDGLIGTATVENITSEYIEIAVALDETAPEPWIDLILAMPRPKTLKRLWPQVAALGVRSVVILTAAKVELCYFGSHAILPEIYRPLLIDGLMQAGTTRVPQVVLRRRFKSFVIDELDELAAGKTCLIAHPGPATISLDKQTVNKNMVLAIGPEGGWTEYELEMFTSNGFQHFSLGERTLRTDTACVAILSVLGYIKLQK